MSDQIPRSSFKTLKDVTSPKHVTFKTPMHRVNSPASKRPSDRLEAAMNTAGDLLTLEANNQQLMQDIKELFAQYHDQSLGRFQLEKMVEQLKKSRQDANLALAEEKKRIYMQITSSMEQS